MPNNEIIELQTKIAFLENTIEALNQALTNQQFAIDKLNQKVNFLAEQVNSNTEAFNTNPKENLPPHY